MLRRNFVLAAVAVFGISVALANADDKKGDAAKDDLKALQGTWEGVKLVIDGKVIGDYSKGRPKDAPVSMLIYNGDKWVIKVGDMVLSSGTSKLDPTKKPKQIDLTNEYGPDKGKTLLGIYEIDGDEYRACVAPAGKERPTEFSSKEGSGHRLIIQKRSGAGR